MWQSQGLGSSFEFRGFRTAGIRDRRLGLGGKSKSHTASCHLQESPPYHVTTHENSSRIVFYTNAKLRSCPDAHPLIHTVVPGQPRRLHALKPCVKLRC